MIWFSSDHHFYHNNVIRYCNRPFESVEQMNEALVIGWNMTVHPDDTVYYLGDFSMAARPVETFTKRLLGTKYFIHGNHDFTHPYHKKSRNKENQEKWIQKYKDWGWTSVQDELIIEHEGQKFRLAHLPYTNDLFHGQGDKYENFRPEDDGIPLLCGHVHEKWTTERSGNGTLMINVGVDRHGFAPISINKVMEIFKANGG
jgi:calcineurin-like phosphoesterase family protein